MDEKNEEIDIRMNRKEMNKMKPNDLKITYQGLPYRWIVLWYKFQKSCAKFVMVLVLERWRSSHLV